MSEPIPESIPTSSYRRPAKRPRIADSTAQQQSSQIDALFANPERVQDIPVGPKPKTLAPPPELVTNVQGSSAGAGSGEFHVYKASRRREYERLRMMDEEVEKEQADRAWQDRREDARRKEEAKLNKNRARRDKAKARQAKAKIGDTQSNDCDTNGATGNGEIHSVKKKLMPAAPASRSDDHADDDNGKVADISAPEQGGLTFIEDD